MRFVAPLPTPKQYPTLCFAQIERKYDKPPQKTRYLNDIYRFCWTNVETKPQKIELQFFAPGQVGPMTTAKIEKNV